MNFQQLDLTQNAEPDGSNDIAITINHTSLRVMPLSFP